VQRALVKASKPAITVAIATYNWSRALRCAIRSVLLQTMQDFEILVVGDGCTDDSASVVAEFDDPRLRWHNFDRNHGGQWAANNFANENAAGTGLPISGMTISSLRDLDGTAHLEQFIQQSRIASTDPQSGELLARIAALESTVIDLQKVCDERQKNHRGPRSGGTRTTGSRSSA
jgi:glycosyltransferase involved in cell wall biosynthesis